MKTPPAERVIKVRKRKKASKGRVIRVSDLVMSFINSRRNNRRRLSHDAYLREVFGLPDREKEAQWIKDGRPALLVEGWVDGYRTGRAKSARFFFEEKDANGAMILDYASKKITRQFKPVRVREVK